MSLMGIIIFIAIGCIAGFVAGKIMRGGGFGFIANLILGVLGGVVGGWLFNLFNIKIGLPELAVQCVTATVGAIIVLAIANLFYKFKK